MRTIFYLLLPVALFYYAIVGGCSSQDPLAYNEVIEENWGISVLREAECDPIFEEEYVMWNGDGWRYHVYSVENEEYLTNALDFIEIDVLIDDVEDVTERCEYVLDTLQIAEGDKPVYADCVYWNARQKDSSEIFILFDQTLGRLYIIEDLY